jgi:hypothetical protein
MHCGDELPGALRICQDVVIRHDGRIVDPGEPALYRADAQLRNVAQVREYLAPIITASELLAAATEEMAAVGAQH